MGTVEAKRVLREADVRVTTPRVLILGYLLDNFTHPTCEQIYSSLKEENSGLSLASVYNVTEKLASEKIINLLVTPDGVKHYDGKTSFHSHFYCNSCETLYDVECDASTINVRFPGAVILNHEVMTKGYCPTCVKRKTGK